MSRPAEVVHFPGWISCRRDGEGPLGLILVGRTADQSGEVVHVAFACPAPVDMPEALEDVHLERFGPRTYRISSGDRAWTLEAAAHVHREVATAFYKAVPPRPVPLRKRLFWRVLLGLAANRCGRWLLLR